MRRYLLAIAAVAVVACTPEKKMESPESLINTQWFSFSEEVENGERIANETLLRFYLKDFKLTNQHIITSADGKQDITYDTIIGKSYSYKRPVGTMVFERETFNPCTIMAGYGTLKVEFTNDTLDFIQN